MQLLKEGQIWKLACLCPPRSECVCLETGFVLKTRRLWEGSLHLHVETLWSSFTFSLGMLIIKFLKCRCSEVKESWCNGIGESQKGLDFRWTPSVSQVTFPWWLPAGDAAQGSQPISLSASDVGSHCGSPVVLRPEDVQTSPWWNHPPLPSKGPCWWKGFPDLQGGACWQGSSLTSLISACLWRSRSCLRVPRKPLLSASRLSAGLQDLVHLSTAGKCWRVSNPNATQLLEDRSQWTGIPAIDLSKGQFSGIFCVVPQADPSRTEPQFSTVVPSFTQ